MPEAIEYPAGGSPYPPVGQPPPTTQGQTDQEFARAALLRDRPGYLAQYEKWGEQHPVLQMGGELLGNYLLSQFGPAILKKLPGGLRTMGDIWEAVNRSGSLGGWGEGAAHIRDPRFKLSKPEETYPGSYHVNIHDTKTGEYYGSASYHLENGGKQLYIGYTATRGDQPGTGQLMHLGREILGYHPEVESIRFYRVSGAGPANKGHYEEVTMPADLIRGKRRQGEEQMFTKSIEQGKGRITRRKMGDTGVPSEPGPEVEAWRESRRPVVNPDLQDRAAHPEQRALRRERIRELYPDFSTREIEDLVGEYEHYWARGETVPEVLGQTPNVYDRVLRGRPAQVGDEITDEQATDAILGHIQERYVQFLKEESAMDNPDVPVGTRPFAVDVASRIRAMAMRMFRDYTGGYGMDTPTLQYLQDRTRVPRRRNE